MDEEWFHAYCNGKLFLWLLWFMLSCQQKSRITYSILHFSDFVITIIESNTIFIFHLFFFSQNETLKSQLLSLAF